MPFQPLYIETPARDLDRALKFYTELLGVTFGTFDDGVRKVAYLMSEEGGVGFSLNQTANFEPSNRGPLVYLNLGADLDAVLQKVESLGGKITTPKTSMGEMGFFAIFEDTEGNAFAISAPPQGA